MLHHDPEIRQKKHDFMKRAMDAAAALGVEAVCGFVGRNQQLNMDANLIDFEENFIPLLKYAKERGLQYRNEQCPMPGWVPGDNWHNNIAYTPGTWIALHRICERHGVGDVFRIHYDPSHAILMGQDTRSIFPVPEGRGLQLLDRRLPRQGAGDGCARRERLGLRRPDGRARRYD
jgi:sugar phosphate isomerase/epimerase